MRDRLFAMAFVAALLTGCAAGRAPLAPHAGPAPNPQSCRRGVDYQSGAFALEGLRAKLDLDAGYRILRIDGLALDTPPLREAGDQIAGFDGAQHNFCLATGLSWVTPAQRDAYHQRMLTSRRTVACLMTSVQTLGVRLRMEDVEKCHPPRPQGAAPAPGRGDRPTAQ